MHCRTLTCFVSSTPRHTLPSLSRNASSLTSWPNSKKKPQDSRGKQLNTRKETSVLDTQLKTFGSSSSTKSESLVAVRPALRNIATSTERKPSPDTFSNQRQEFDALEVDEYDETQQEFGAGIRSFNHIPPGSFVECRRNVTPLYGIVIVQPNQVNWKLMMLTGEVVNILPTDIHFVITNAVDAQTANLCGSEHESPERLRAQIQALKVVRSIMYRTELEYTRISRQMSTVYDTFRAEDPSGWSKLTTSEAARAVADGRSHLSPTTLLAVHQHLMSRYHHFTVDSADFLISQLFHVRPLNLVEICVAVEKMLARNDPNLDSFVQKARQILSDVGKAETAARSGPPSLRPYTGVSFSKGELPIVRFLQATALPRRYTQRSPYLVAAAALIRRVEACEERIDENEVAVFLRRLGLNAAWDDLVSHNMERPLTPSTGSGEHSLRPIAQASNILRHLGPQDYFTTDIVASARHDFGDLPVYIIDDVGAQELDDGVSIEPVSTSKDSFWAHVHIADPTALLPPTHEYAKMAHRQAVTNYLVHKTIPLLPKLPEFESLSLGSSSGNSTLEKVMTASFLVDKEGTIRDYKIRPGLVRNVHRLLYDDVDAALGLPEVQPFYPFGAAPPPVPRTPLNPTQLRDLKLLASVTKRLVAWRVKRGAMMMGHESAEISVNPLPLETLPLDVSTPHISSGFPGMKYRVISMLSNETGTRAIVAELMKAASRVTSMFMRDNGLPAIRRTVGPFIYESESAFAELMSQRRENGMVPNIAAALRAGIRPGTGTYTTSLEGHCQLGIPDGEGYVHFTSPLRRYIDMLAHWQIKHAIAAPGTMPLFGEEWMKKCAWETTAKMLSVKKVATSSRDFWALKFIQRWMEHPEDRPEGVEDPLQNLIAVPTATPRRMLDGTYGMICVLPALGLRGTLLLKDYIPLEPGDSVRVKVHALRFGFSPRIFVSPK
ncbi:hypothetical protein BXZ70DRAFT_940057 [Cristinia sonorae]|uniref:RNB domain-containing protein n=1 Tax=Cristinia sonorae TaxID=1940300 RepID=A0A8K0UPP5_9AGAR|nr:hypothetical protein BXZ70DRAFT_940057 [Cristinia sonorae]